MNICGTRRRNLFIMKPDMETLFISVRYLKMILKQDRQEKISFLYLNAGKQQHQTLKG